MRHVPDNQLLSGLAQVRYCVVDQFQQLSYNALRTIQLQLLPHTCNQNHTSGSSSDWKKREELPLLLLCREIGSLVSTDCSRSGLAWGSAGRATGDQNSKVMGSNPTLVTVFLCPWGGLFFFVGLTLRWRNSEISQHRNLLLKNHWRENNWVRLLEISTWCMLNEVPLCTSKTLSERLLGIRFCQQMDEHNRNRRWSLFCCC